MKDDKYFECLFYGIEHTPTYQEIKDALEAD